MLLAFSCKRRGLCPSCAGRRMAQTAAHLVERVLPWVPTRQWVVSVPVPLRYGMATSQELTAQVHTLIRTTIGQYDVHQTVARGIPWAKVPPGAVTFLQHFGSAMHVNLHCPGVFLEGISLDRTAASLTPRFGQGEPPAATAIAAGVPHLRRRIVHTLRHLGSLEAGRDAAVATGSAPLGDDAPEFARPLAASVPQRLALGERAGQQVRHLGAGLGHEGEVPS